MLSLLLIQPLPLDNEQITSRIQANIFLWGPGDFPWGRPNRENCTLAEKQQTHWGRPFQSA